MPWSTPAPTDSSAHHSARPSACATSVSARHSRVWPQRGTSCVAGIVGCAFRSPLQTRIGTGTGIRPPGLPERTSVTGRRSRTRAGSAGKRPATHTGYLLPVSKRRDHPGGEVNAGGFGGQSPTTRARSAHDIKPRRSPQCSAGRYNTFLRVEFWTVGRKVFDVEAWVSRAEFLDRLPFMGGGVIQKHDEGTAELP